MAKVILIFEDEADGEGVKVSVDFKPVPYRGEEPTMAQHYGLEISRMIRHWQSEEDDERPIIKFPGAGDKPPA